MYVVQYDLLVIVTEIDAVKHHIAFHLHIIHGMVRLMFMPPCPAPGTGLALHQPAVLFFYMNERHIAVVRLRLLIQHLEDALRAGHGHNDGIELLTDLVNRHVKAPVKGQEAGQRSQRQAGDPGERQRTAHYGADYVTHIAQLHVHRTDDIDQIIGPVRTVIEVFVQLIELLNILFLMAEDLHHLLTFHHFFDKSVDLTDISLLLQKIPSADPGRPGRHYQHHRHHHQSHDRQRHA